MKAVITVLGNDKRGIIYNVTKILAESDVNILDISQTILDGYFTMVMIVDIEKCNVKFEELQNRLEAKGEEMELNIRIQHKQIFDSMHNI
ncbi:MAG: ACT domain-containing protein [Clostridiales bacterium]|nr:ACT domain-containing protein [Clostridiales bacterium]